MSDFAEQVFESGTENMDAENTPESFDELMENENDSDNQESIESSEGSDTEVLSEEADGEDFEGSAESGQPSEQAADDSGKGEEEAGPEGKESEEVEKEGEESSDPISKYLKEEEEVKADGQIHKFSREALLEKGKEMIAGEIAWDKKFSELDVQRKQYQQEVSEVEGYINKFGEIAQTGDVLGALQYFSEFTHVPPYELKQQLIQQLVPEVDRLRGLSDAERQLEYTQQKTEFLEKQYETESQRVQQHQAQREVELQAMELQQAHNIAPEEWKAAASELQEHLNGSQEVTPELVASYIAEDRAYVQAENLLDTVDVNLKADDAIVDQLQAIIKQNPSWTEDDLKDVVNQAFANDQTEEQTKQLAERVTKNTPKQLKQKVDSDHAPITINGEEVDDWDDII